MLSEAFTTDTKSMRAFRDYFEERDVNATPRMIEGTGQMYSKTVWLSLGSRWEYSWLFSSCSIVYRIAIF